MTDRPNLLFITTDQHRGDCFGFTGRRVKTPVLDALAAAGTRFDTCITPNVVCQPARASLLTGLLPRTHGVHDNGIDLDEARGAAGFAGQLGAAGYRTGFIGKAHFSTATTFAPTGRPECRESARQFGPDWHGPYMGFDHAELCVLGHFELPIDVPPAGQHYEARFHRGGLGAERMAQYHRRVFDDAGAFDTLNSGLPEAFSTSAWTADRALHFLREQAGQQQPFCLWVSFPDPHPPFDCPDPWARLHHPDEVDLPPHPTLDLERRPWWHTDYRKAVPPSRGERIDFIRRNAQKPKPPQSEAQLRRITANYYGMISLIDHHVGRLLEALDAQGQRDATVVIFTSDHGEWLGDHGLVTKGPMHYDGLLRVGCMLAGPGIPAGRVVSGPVSTVDLAPTLLELGGAPVPDHLHGRSLRPLWCGADATRDFAYNEWEILEAQRGIGLDLRTVRTARWRMTWERNSDAGELYDLRDDPHEMDNRFDDAELRAVRAELTDMVRSRPDDALAPLPEPSGIA